MTNLDALPSTAGYHDLRLSLDKIAPNTEIAVTLHLPMQPRHAPLVMVLHYGGPPTEYYGRGLLEQLVVPAWQALDAVFVAPVIQGAAWQSAFNRDRVRALLARLESHYETSPHARYLVGYSLGAIGCWHWLMETAVPFTAVVPIAGPVPDELDVFTTPVYALHSDADRLFASAPIQRRMEALRAANCPLDYRIIQGIDHFNVAGYRAELNALAERLRGK